MDNDHFHRIEDEPESALHLAESEGVQTRVERREESIEYVGHVEPPYDIPPLEPLCVGIADLAVCPISDAFWPIEHRWHLRVFCTGAL